MKTTKPKKSEENIYLSCHLEDDYYHCIKVVNIQPNTNTMKTADNQKMPMIAHIIMIGFISLLFSHTATKMSPNKIQGTEYNRKQDMRVLK
jgi:hypothetical protein